MGVLEQGRTVRAILRYLWNRCAVLYLFFRIAADKTDVHRDALYYSHSGLLWHYLCHNFCRTYRELYYGTDHRKLDVGLP